jgi:hypothetical protein
MPGPLFANNASGTLASSYSAAATAITLNANQGLLFPAPSAGDWFMATITNALNQIEIVKVTAKAGDTFTVVRGQEGTSARALAAGDKIDNRLTAGTLMLIRSTPVDPTTIPDNSVNGSKLVDGSVSNAKLAGGITAAKLAGGIDNSKLAAGVAIANLGFTPVNQGGGISQTSDNVFIGWSTANKLRLTVGVTDLGFILTERQDGSAGSAGYRGVPPNYEDADYTIGTIDNGRSIVHSLGIHTYTLPPDSTPIDPGGIVQIINRVGAGVLAIAPGAGVTLIAVPGGASGARSLAAPGVATAEKVGSNTWYVYGAGLT